MGDVILMGQVASRTEFLVIACRACPRRGGCAPPGYCASTVPTRRYRPGMALCPDHRRDRVLSRPDVTNPPDTDQIVSSPSVAVPSMVFDSSRALRPPVTIQDQGAVKAALTEPWSNGQTEGQNTKLKLVKRQMYGRAGLDLLKARLLGAV